MSGISDFDRLFAACIGALAGIYLARCVLGASFYLLGSLPGRLGSRCRELADRVTPTLVRRTASTLIGAAVVGSGVAPVAQAAPAPVAPGSQHSAVNVPELERGPLEQHTREPERAKPLRNRAVTQDPMTNIDRSSESSSTIVVVKSGDSLWHIAKRQLRTATPQQTPSDSAIDAEWRRWYDANRQVVGPEPDVIKPGLRMVAPLSGSTK
ncbi:MAG: LysM peptidoglycan-binding domain-containing protein [Candidatus Nanopelagicales bacterium]